MNDGFEKLRTEMKAEIQKNVREEIQKNVKEAFLEHAGADIPTSKVKGHRVGKRKNPPEGEANPQVAATKLVPISLNFKEIGMVDLTVMPEPTEIDLETFRPTVFELANYHLCLQTEGSKAFHFPIVVSSSNSDVDWMVAQFSQLLDDDKKGVAEVEFFSFVIEDESSKKILVVTQYQNDTVGAFIFGQSDDENKIDRAKKHENLVLSFTKCFFNDFVKKKTQVQSVNFRESEDIKSTCSAIHSHHLFPRFDPPSAFSDIVQFMVFSDVVTILANCHDKVRQPNAFVSGAYFQQLMIEILQSTRSPDEVNNDLTKLEKHLWYTYVIEIIFHCDIVDPLSDINPKVSTRYITQSLFWMYQLVDQVLGSSELFVFFYVLCVWLLTQFFYLFSE
jgi:hypothetical protein